MRFGVCTGPENAHLAAAAGYDYLELAVASHLRPEADLDLSPLALLPLPVEAFNLFVPGEIKLGGDVVDWERVTAYVQSAVPRAAAAGASIIVFGSGGARNIPEGGDRMVTWKNLERFLTLCSDVAADTPVAIAIEPLNRSECNIVNSVAEGMDLVRAVGRPNIAVLSDLYHVDVEKQDYAETVDAGPNLIHVHVAGAGRRAPTAEDIPFLTGYFRAVKAAGYTGRVSVECRWENVDTEFQAALDTMRTAWDAAL